MAKTCALCGNSIQAHQKISPYAPESTHVACYQNAVRKYVFANPGSVGKFQTEVTEFCESLQTNLSRN
jgi:hypothetical protein